VYKSEKSNDSEPGKLLLIRIIPGLELKYGKLFFLTIDPSESPNVFSVGVPNVNMSGVKTKKN